MGMYHKNRLAGIRSKRFAKRCTSRGRRRTVKKAAIFERLINMSDCYDEEYRISDISVFGEIREVQYKGWQPNRLIEIVDSNGKDY